MKGPLNSSSLFSIYSECCAWHMEGAQYVLCIFQVLRLSSKQTYLPAYVAYILVRTKDEEAEKEYKLVST